MQMVKSLWEGAGPFRLAAHSRNVSKKSEVQRYHAKLRNLGKSDVVKPDKQVLLAAVFAVLLHPSLFRLFVGEHAVLPVEPARRGEVESPQGGILDY